jgi:pantothenate kinase
MNPDLQKELFARLDVLASKLGVAANQLWDILLLQAKVEAIQSIFLGVVFLSASLIFLKIGFHYKKIWTECDHESDGEIAGTIGGFVLSGFSFLVFLSNVHDLPTLLFNPGYYALTHLLSELK